MMTSYVSNNLDKLYDLGLKSEWCGIVLFNIIKKTSLNRFTSLFSNKSCDELCEGGSFPIVC